MLFLFFAFVLTVVYFIIITCKVVSITDDFFIRDGRIYDRRDNKREDDNDEHIR